MTWGRFALACGFGIIALSVWAVVLQIQIARKVDALPSKIHALPSMIGRPQ